MSITWEELYRDYTLDNKPRRPPAFFTLSHQWLENIQVVSHYPDEHGVRRMMFVGDSALATFRKLNEGLLVMQLFAWMHSR